MKIKAELDPQVADFIRSLAPDPRKRLREVLHALKNEQGDIKQLEAELAGYARLRVGTYRIIIRFYADRGQRIARCIFAERRPVVYELFAEILRGESSSD